MNYPVRPSYTAGEIDRAGNAARSFKPGTEDYKEAIGVINGWRAAHAYPMHTFYVTLRRRALLISRKSLVARRLKRLVTILDKIGGRQESMRLSRMQDIGGVRAILPKVKHVYVLRDKYANDTRFPHVLKRSHDYILSPKPSGYRGVHLVYSFNNAQGRSPVARDYDGLLVEVQMRTQLQHEWATAVEIVGTMLGDELKSSIGDANWLEFFQCMSSVIATLEDSPVLAAHREWTTAQLFNYTAELAQKIEMINTIAGWVTGLKSINERGGGGYYHILLLDIQNKKVRMLRYLESELEEATQKLAEFEQAAAVNGDPEPVLVAAGDITKLRKAYPNYFLDMKDFLQLTSYVIETADGTGYNSNNEQ